MTIGFDGVDHAPLCWVRQLEGGAAGIQDRNACVAVTFERGLFSESEYVSVEVDGGGVVVGFDDKTQLSDTGRRRGFVRGHGLDGTP